MIVSWSFTAYALLLRHYPTEHAETVRLAGAVLEQVAMAYAWQREALAAATAGAGLPTARARKAG